MWNAKQTGVLRVNGTNEKSSQLTDFLLLLNSSIGDWKKPAENWKPWALQIENDHFIANWSENANTKINKINFKIQLTTQRKKRIGLNYPASVQRRYLEKSQPHTEGFCPLRASAVCKMSSHCVQPKQGFNSWHKIPTLLSIPLSSAKSTKQANPCNKTSL